MRILQRLNIGQGWRGIPKGQLMTNEEQRIIGGLSQAFEDLRRQAEINRQENRADFNKVFADLADLKSKGCAVGKHNASEIESLKGRPERALSLGAIIISALVAVTQIFKFWKGSP
jgi:hypothetical protein